MTAIKPLLASLDKPHLVHNNIQALIEKLSELEGVSVRQVGESFEQRSIYLLSMGQGPITIFAWTQMHGNEATATAAVFDLIDSLVSSTNSVPASIRNTWQQQFTLHILPMLNPDGAQRCIRQNAQGIDINRDARALQSPEGRLLLSLVDELKPDIGFNLHDQSPYYQCGLSGNPATIAFLAPAFDIDKTIDASRSQAMQIITHMNKALQSEIPNCIARYDDTYSPRSFGDNIAALKVSTILIESGAAANDPNRQIARRLNVTAMLSAMDYLTIGSASRVANKTQDIENYFGIPENISEALSSLLLTDVGFANTSEHAYRAGVSIKQSARYSDHFFVDYIGDLGVQAGLEHVNCDGLHYQQGKCFEVSDAKQLTKQAYKELMSAGYLYFYAKSAANKALLDVQTDLPIHWLDNPDHALHLSHSLCLNQAAYFLLEKNNKVISAVVNGRYVDLLS
jgi:hypothetical protein